MMSNSDSVRYAKYVCCYAEYVEVNLMNISLSVRYFVLWSACTIHLPPFPFSIFFFGFWSSRFL